MQAHENTTLILTVRLDPESQAFFNAGRERYFPPERNLLTAHLTLFHQLPDNSHTHHYLAALQFSSFEIQVTGLINLGAGVAYRLESTELKILFHQLQTHFLDVLIPQDRQGFRSHITIMNKSTPENARSLIAELSAGFKKFNVRAIGLDLWVYLNGPWQHEIFFPFIQ